MNRQKYYIELTTDPVVFTALLKAKSSDETSRNELGALICLLEDRLHGKITEYPDRLFSIVWSIVEEVTGNKDKPITADYGVGFGYIVIKYVTEDNVERYTYDFAKLVIHEITGEITPEDTLPYFHK